jgi:hypothetical protein
LWRVSGKKKNTKTMAKVFNDTIPVQTCQSTHNASGPLGPPFFTNDAVQSWWPSPT